MQHETSGEDELRVANAQQADPFRTQPSPYAAAEQYLARAYEGPQRAEVYGMSSVSFGFGVLALLQALLIGANALLPVKWEFMQLAAHISAILDPAIALIAIVLGHISYLRANRANLRGRGLSVAGFIFGYVSLAIIFGGILLARAAFTPTGVV